MNREDIIRMAREAGLLGKPTYINGLEAFAALIASAAIKEALAQPEQKPVAWPKTPAEISDMIGSSYVWREHKISDVEPHESDKYCVTAHDLLEAFENWNEYTTPPQRKPLTDEEIILIVADCASSHQHTDIHFARAIEAAIWEKQK